MTMATGRLEPHDHARHQWRVDEIAPDFDLIDAWALPAEGTAAEFDQLCDAFAAMDLQSDTSRPAQALFAIRSRLGELFGWDDEVNVKAIPGCSETSLRERLPPDLLPESGDTAGRLPFRPVYRTADEWALELSNATAHAIVHLGWVPTSSGRYQGQLGIYVKTRGRLGPPYMAVIAPFRHYIVYPALLKRIGRAWDRRPEASPSRQSGHNARP